MQALRRQLFIGAIALVLTVGCGDDEPASPGSTSSGSGGAASSSSSTGPAGGSAGATGGSGGAGGSCESIGLNENPTDLVITEIDLGAFIELYNPTGAAMDLGQIGYIFLSRPDSVAFDSVATGFVIPPGGYRTIAWPILLGEATPTNGELAIYRNTSFDDPTALIDYVCWGMPNPTSQPVATTAGQWDAGPCATVTNGKLRRLPDTTGDSAGAWEEVGLGDATNCDP